MACPDADAQAACGCSAGKQDGAENLGHADETGRLPGTSVIGGGMIHTGLNKLMLVKEV